LNVFVNEIHLVALFEPSIVERIEEDLDRHAEKKKLLRLADAQFLAGQTPDLPKLHLQLRELKSKSMTSNWRQAGPAPMPILKSFIDSTAVEANTERPTDSIILVRLIARVCTTGSNLHQWDLPDMNQIGLLEQLEELRRMSQQIHFLNGKARGEAKRKQPYRQARVERSAIELVFTLKEGFEFGEMVRSIHENVLAEMLEKVLAYNISQIIRVKKKLSEPQQMERAAA
jgi:hypothetical protein